MTKILHFCLACFYIDNHSYQENMLPKFHKRLGFDVKIIASTVNFNSKGELYFDNKHNEYVSVDGIPVIRLPYKKPVRINSHLRVYEGLYEEIEKYKPDILFIHGGQFLDILQIVKYLKKNTQVSVFVDNHTDRINSMNNMLSKHVLHNVIWRFCFKKINPFVKTFWGVTPARSKFLNEVYNIDLKKIQTLPMGIDDDSLKLFNRVDVFKKYKNIYSLGDNDIIVVTGGKIDMKKNIHILLDVFKLLPETYKLIVFGTVNDEMRPIFENLDDILNVKYVGWKNQTEIIELFTLADLAVFPGTHSVLWEQAIGFGLPTIVKYWEGFDHLYLNKSISSLVNIDVDELKKTILFYGDHLAELKSIAKQNYKQFSYSTISKKAIGYVEKEVK